MKKHLAYPLSLLLAANAISCGSASTAPELQPPPAPVPAPAQPAEPYEALLAPWDGPYTGVPPFDKAKVEYFQPALEKGAEMLLAEVDAIGNSSEPPTFDNTLVALERAGAALDRAETLYYVHARNLNTPEVQAISGDVESMLSATYDKIYFHDGLFQRIEAVYQNRQGLQPEQKRLVERQYEEFVRRGAKLSAAQKDQLGALNTKLAKIFTEFSNRVLADEDTWVLLDKEQLGGLPDTLVASMKAAAEERKLDGYAVVNTRSAVEPFLTFSTDRALREKVWRGFTNRGDNGDKNDTNDLIREIVKIRAERAALLGYPSHAHWRMSNTMAEDPKRAEELMMRVWPAAVKRVEEEVADMQALADKEGAKITVEPWDYRFYMEKVRKDRYALDQNEFKNYFELENMIEASYYMAERLYGYGFREITSEVSGFHPDVRVYQVINKADGSHVGVLYRDDFARQYKRSGAWQATYRVQEKIDGQVDAIVSNNNNFSKGQAGEPVLISLNDAETLFHEFGHALHALSMDVTYPSLYSTPRDFVEFPSQVHENWVLTREVLDKYARHYKTNEPMPQELIDKMRKASTFNQGFATVEYLSAAIVDMRLHTDPSGQVDPDAFEKKISKEIGMPDEIVLRHRLPQFLHLFASDAYSAGYYSYLWSDVMAADAWAAFEEAGDPWHKPTADKFVEIILSTGNAIDRAEAYRLFRGRDPKVEALLENRGFPTGG